MEKEKFEKVEIIQEGTFIGWLRNTKGDALNPKSHTLYIKSGDKR